MFFRLSNPIFQILIAYIKLDQKGQEIHLFNISPSVICLLTKPQIRPVVIAHHAYPPIISFQLDASRSLSVMLFADIVSNVLFIVGDVKAVIAVYICFTQ